MHLYKKTYNHKVVKKLSDIILDINELSDKRIIAITKNKIILLKKENKDYVVKKEYLIKDNWKITPISSELPFFGNFNQYFSSCVLPNDRLLLNSFSTEISYNGGCGTHPPTEFSNSKIIFIGFGNFEEITSTKTFGIDARFIVFEKIIIINASKYLFIYDVNTLKMIKKKELKDNYSYMHKFNNRYIIFVSEDEEKNDLTIYKINKNKDLIKHSSIKVCISFEKIFSFNVYDEIGFNNKFLLTLNDKRTIILRHKKIYVLNLTIN